MRRLLAVAFGLALVSGCLPFKDDGLYACDTGTGKDCVTCDAATGWCRDITAITKGAYTLKAINGKSGVVYAVGGNGVIVRWNGSRWVPESSGTDEQFNSVWVASTDDIFAVGSNYTWVHSDGGAWKVFRELSYFRWPWVQPDPPPPYTTVTVEHLTAVGGAVEGRNGVAWTTDTQGMINFIFNDGVLNWPDKPFQSDNYWYLDGVAQDGMVAVPVVTTDPSTQLMMRGIWSDQLFNAYFVGHNGAILKDTDAATDWAGMLTISNPDPAKENLYAVWGDSSTGNVVAVGAAGAVARFNNASAAGGAVWSNAGVGVELYGLCGVNENDVFAVGGGGAVRHWDGVSWTAYAQPYAETLWGVYCTAGDIWAVTEEGAILHKKRP